MSAVLEIQNAHKRFGETEVLSGAGFSLLEGEWLALLGPNGAGKTTLVRSVAGRVRLDQGSITLLGETLREETTARSTRAKLGIVPQDIALYLDLSATENMRAFGALNGLTGKRLEDRTRWALAWTGLSERADEPIKQFSGGMRRRLNIACSVLHEPDVILLDEPTVGVDPQSRQLIWEMLEGLRSRGASLLLTTHQLDEAQQICERIVIIDNGRTIADGTFEELLLQTIGPERQVTFYLRGAAPEDLREAGFEIVDGTALRCSVDDVAKELPGLLAGISAAGGEVQDLTIQAPTLQAVFIHLTGRELRE